MPYEALTQGLANIVLAMFDDTCTLIPNEFENVDGVVTPIEDEDSWITDIKCAFEPLRKTEQVQQMIDSGFLSVDVTHRILLPVTDYTMSLKPDWTLIVNAREFRPEYTFERPQRMDESLSSLLIVAAVLRNQ